MKKILGKEITIYGILAIATLLVFGSNIWGVDIYILDEAKNAECAREMRANNDFIVPYFNGELRTAKPPLHYYFMAVAYSLFGVSAFAARFFSVIMGIATILISYFYTHKYLGKEIAFWTAIILLSSINFVLEFHLSVPDPYLIFFLNLGLFAFYDFYQSANRWSLWLMYVSLALATLTKGPVALVLPVAIFFIFLLAQKDFRVETLKRFKILRGSLLFFAIALPWYILVSVKTDFEWTRGFFLTHNIDRFSEPMEGHGGLFLLTPLFVLIGMLPFSLFIVRGIKVFWKERKNSFLLFSFISALTIVVFFSISSTKLPNYPMPSYPAWAILIATGILALQPKKLTPVLIINLLVGVLLVIGAYFGIRAEKEISHLGHLAWGLGIFPLTGVLLFFLQKKSTTVVLSGLALSWIVSTSAIFYFIYPKINEQNPVAQSLKVIPSDSELAYYGAFNPAFPFNLDNTIEKLESLEEVKSFLELNPKGWLLTTDRYKKELDSLDQIEISVEKKFLFENPTSLVYRLRVTNELIKD
ncbi:MAG: glycosyltransferase family 39 protein [Bacteroidales bacterium]|nr:glycosyltransferase family 39 protein [Bacteroidales bacterium]MCF8455731.1 glycosyltransferase family 39 protein [Bacteroidales bacterium]